MASTRSASLNPGATDFAAARAVMEQIIGLTITTAHLSELCDQVILEFDGELRCCLRDAGRLDDEVRKVTTDYPLNLLEGATLYYITVFGSTRAVDDRLMVTETQFIVLHTSYGMARLQFTIHHGGHHRRIFPVIHLTPIDELELEFTDA